MSEQGFDRLVPMVFLFCGDESAKGRLPLGALDEYCIETEVYEDAPRFAKDVLRLRPDICFLFLAPGAEQSVVDRVADIRADPDHHTASVHGQQFANRSMGCALLCFKAFFHFQKLGRVLQTHADVAPHQPKWRCQQKG